MATPPRNPKDPKSSPRKIHITVGKSGIIADNQNPAAYARNQPHKVWACAGGEVTFEIKNLDPMMAHTVRIPIDEFQPSPTYGDATPNPLVGREQDGQQVTVGPGASAEIIFQVKGKDALFNRDRWIMDSALSMTYEYNIYATTSGGQEACLDPEIEIDQP